MSRAADRFGRYAAIGVLAGILLSGPGALLILQLTHPQPMWAGPAEFARNYHAIQTLPFFTGFILVLGFVSLIASLHASAEPDHRASTTTALVLTAVFAALIFLNYCIQTTFVPGLVRPYSDANASAVSAFSMSNPRSLAWSLEMWGYAVLGLATWLIAPAFRANRLERGAALAFRLNAPISVGGAIWTAADPGWVLTLSGYVALGIWNLLVIVMALLAFVTFHSRRSESA